MLLLISGHNRSGTTLTQRLCNSHPDIGMTDELGHFLDLNAEMATYCRRLLSRWWQAQNRPFLLNDGLWEKWSYHPVCMAQCRGSRVARLGKIARVSMLQNLYLIARYLRYLRRFRSPKAAPAVVEGALRQVFQGTRVVGDNGPDYLGSLGDLVQVEGLRCVVVYRDARDVVSDVLKRMRPRTWHNGTGMEHDLRHWWPRDLGSATTVARRWVEAIRIMERHGDEIHTIRYEALVTTPEPVLASLGEWLGVEPGGFDSQIIRPGGTMGSYRDGLSDQELAEVLAVAGPNLEQLGYAIDPRKPGRQPPSAVQSCPRKVDWHENIAQIE